MHLRPTKPLDYKDICGILFFRSCRFSGQVKQKHIYREFGSAGAQRGTAAAPGRRLAGFDEYAQSSVSYSSLVSFLNQGKEKEALIIWDSLVIEALHALVPQYRQLVVFAESARGRLACRNSNLNQARVPPWHQQRIGHFPLGTIKICDC